MTELSESALACNPHSTENIDLPLVGSLEEYFRKCLNVSEANETFQQLQELLRGIHEENKLRSDELIALLVINAGMMLFGGAGAIILIAAVIRKPRMRTPRNLLTVNLAVCDLTLCIFTQPFNLIRTLHWHYEWRFGEAMCKFTSFAQATNVFVATMSITVIALDRFHVIVHPLQSKRVWNRPLIVLPCLWLLGFVMATPMLAFCTVYTGLTVAHSSAPRLVCVEASFHHPGMHRFKYAYGIFTLICQYFVPFAILLAVYIRICTRIRKLSRVRTKLHQASLNFAAECVNRASAGSPIEDDQRIFLEVKAIPGQVPTSNSHSGQINGVFSLALQKRKLQDRSRKRRRRQRRTNILLTCVSLAFGLSWLPLHAVNIFMDYQESEVNLAPPTNQTTNGDGKFMGARHITLIQSFCLLCTLCSSCANPLLYGYLNDNYKKEISEILRMFFCCCCWTRWRSAYTHR